MSLERRHGWFLVAVAGWSFLIWATFARNLYDAWSDGEDRAQGYWVAHSVLIVVSVVLAVFILRLGLRVLRGTRTRTPT